MNKNKVLIILIFPLLIFSCDGINQKEEVIGLYVSRNNVNTIDTVRILENGTYINTMYRKSDSSLIYKNVGKWQIADGYVTFEDFYKEEDEVHSKEVTNYEDVLMTTKLPLERKNGKIIIHHKAMHEDIYLEKVE